MDYIEICENDYNAFHELASPYYREGEDADTPQEEIDTFIRFLFEKVINHEINGYIAKDKNAYVGFALWGVDTEDFEFSEIPGFGTILEIGFIPSYRSKGNGKELVSYIGTSRSSSNIPSPLLSLTFSHPLVPRPPSLVPRPPTLCALNFYLVIC